MKSSLSHAQRSLPSCEVMADAQHEVRGINGRILTLDCVLIAGHVLLYARLHRSKARCTPCSTGSKPISIALLVSQIKSGILKARVMNKGCQRC